MSDDFFGPPEPPASPSREPRYRTPPWFGPPEGELPGVVAVELLLARTDRVAVALSGLRAFSTGFSFGIATIGAPDLGEELDPFLFGAPHGRPAAGDGLRYGVEFADGRRATSQSWKPPSREEPPQPVMHSGGGGGGGGNWHQDVWVWPLPPAGGMAFVLDWEAAGIPLTRHEIDAGLILEASKRAVTLFDYSVLPPWPDAGSGDGPEWVDIR